MRIIFEKNQKYTLDPLSRKSVYVSFIYSDFIHGLFLLEEPPLLDVYKNQAIVIKKREFCSKKESFKASILNITILRVS